MLIKTNDATKSIVNKNVKTKEFNFKRKTMNKAKF